MTAAGLYALLPYIILTVALVVIMVVIAFNRNHRLTLILTLLSLAIAFASLFLISNSRANQITALLRIDGFAVFYLGLVIAASFVVAALAYGYLKNHAGNHDEFYLLLLSATLGSAVLVASTHFASFFLGLEILSISLYAMIAYQYTKAINVEAGAKYLILAAVSAAFLLFGMALIYAELGTMEFDRVASSLGNLQGVNTLY
jgi:NADH-quinone oxidoreductase subunit N